MGAVLRIAVTPRSLSDGKHPGLQRLRDAGFDLVFPAPGRMPTAAELHAAVPGCTGYLAGTEPIDAELLGAASGLRVIARNGVGVDSIDLDAAARAGVEVLPALGANSQGVAELAIALVLANLRGIPWHDERLKSGEWQRRIGFEANGRVLGVIGCGQIGQRVARMAIGIGMRVVAFDAYPSETFDPGESFTWAPLDEVVRTSDVLTLHAPASPDGPLLDAEALASTKRGVFIVNTARAALVDADAMLSGLESGAIGGYATDVFDTEPPEPSPLTQHPRMITTPHLGGYTGESVDRAADAAIDNLLRVLGTPS